MKARFHYFGSRDFRAAKEELRLAARGLPNDPALLELSAVVQRRMGNWSDAIRDGEKAAALDPHQPSRLLSLAESYRALHRFNEAELVADRAIAALPPNVSDPFFWIKSDAAMGRRDLKTATAMVEKATGDLPQTHWRRARLLALGHQFAQANREIDKLSSQLPEQPYWLFATKAFVAQMNGDGKEARAQYTRAYDLLIEKLKVQPDDLGLLSEFGPIAGALGRKEEALRAAQRATALVPTSTDHVDGPEYEIALAQTYALLGEANEALVLLQRLSGAPCGPLVGDLELDPSWNNIRRDPRFARIVREAARPVQP